MNDKGEVDYVWSHGVISDEMYANITKHCKFDQSDGDACHDAKAYDSANTDPYDIYGPVCVRAPGGTFYSSRYIPWQDPCSNHYVDAYLNDPEIQKALHARATEWSHCTGMHLKDSPGSMVQKDFYAKTSKTTIQWTDWQDSVVRTLKWLMKHKLRVWLFSGDFDSVCSLTATRYTIHDLGVTVTEPWRPWTEGKEVGGYVQGYTGGLVLASVRGAGHMVPFSQPERALILVSSFLNGTLPAYE